jgi:hypothetical protein
VIKFFGRERNLPLHVISKTKTNKKSRVGFFISSRRQAANMFETDGAMALWWEARRKQQVVENMKLMRQKFQLEVERAVSEGRNTLDEMQNVLSSRPAVRCLITL